MSSKYEDLEKLRDLYAKGIITEEEFNAEKAKLLNPSTGKSIFKQTNDNRSYNSLMHLSQFSGYFFPFMGIIVPIVMWITRREESESVDTNGKIILNWKISTFLYSFIFVALFIAAIVASTGTLVFTSGNFEGLMDENPFYIFRILGVLSITILPIIVICILDFIFTIIGAIKAGNGEVWNYPLSIRFFKTPASTPKNEVKE